ncbi:conserved Plasmodium protein, unknown function [Plasmodium vivax]|uniref:Uncharacterized protein n=1 Tax=Plasmodium vivax TaxID=5855 RepID=A0A1G4GXV0_PLAVI|nr:conserved Plasmodium protein, unknown function [Plasmodium vivax]
MKIPDLLKLLNRHREIKQDDLDNINIQIINTLNEINPNKIINNIVRNNVRGRHDLKSLRKKIYFNHLLLKTGAERGNFFKAYECREETSGRGDSPGGATTEVGEVNEIDEFTGVQKNPYGRNKRKVKMGAGPQRSNGDKNTECNEVELNTELLTDLPSGEDQRGKTKFTFFELASSYSNFVLDNILRHVCSYIYNYKVLNKINEEENKGHELVSLFLMSSIFHHFFELKFGYSYMVHFLNGLKVYKIKREINVHQVGFEIIHGYAAVVEEEARGGVTPEGEADPVLEKVYDVSFIIDYLSEHANRNDSGIAMRKNLPPANLHNFSAHTFEDAKKKQTYVVNAKDKILLSYSVDESYLNHFLHILQNKYNPERISFSNYCLLVHMYSMSNHFVVNMFAALPLSFLKNKMDANVNILIILLNSCLFFLRGKSFLNTPNAFHIHVVSDEGKLIGGKECVRKECVRKECVSKECVRKECVRKECVSKECESKECVSKECESKESLHKESVHMVKEKMYALAEQLINYIFQNKGTLNNDHLLQLFEILSFVKYNKALFSYIFHKMNGSLCLLDKYQIFYFLNSLANYDIVCNGARRDIRLHTLKHLEQYSPRERQRLEGYLHARH